MRRGIGHAEPLSITKSNPFKLSERIQEIIRLAVMSYVRLQLKPPDAAHISVV